MLRKALGDTVPREWVEFAATQSERTRRDFAERLAAELGKSLRSIDLEELATRLLQSHTIEVNARIRFRPRGEDEAERDHSVRVRGTRGELVSEASTRPGALRFVIPGVIPDAPAPMPA